MKRLPLSLINPAYPLSTVWEFNRQAKMVIAEQNLTKAVYPAGQDTSMWKQTQPQKLSNRHCLLPA
jgi:hypothetical protein